MEVRILVGNSSGCDGAQPDAPARTPFQKGGSPPPSFQAHCLLTSHNCTSQGCLNAVQPKPSLLAQNSEPFRRAIPAAELMGTPLYCHCLTVQLLLSILTPFSLAAVLTNTPSVHKSRTVSQQLVLRHCPSNTRRMNE